MRDHRIDFTVNGFNPTRNVHWEFVNFKENINTYDYFGTDKFGGFDKSIIADEMKSGSYTLRFFNDKINDFIKDQMDQKLYYIIKYLVIISYFGIINLGKLSFNMYILSISNMVYKTMINRSRNKINYYRGIPLSSKQTFDIVIKCFILEVIIMG